MIKKVVCWVLVCVFVSWFCVSVGYSIAASVDEDFTTEGGRIEDRLGLVVVQVARIYEDNEGETCDRWGYYMSGEPGDIAVMVWNPFTTYFDDIILRFDF